MIPVSGGVLVLGMASTIRQRRNIEVGVGDDLVDRGPNWRLTSIGDVR